MYVYFEPGLKPDLSTIIRIKTTFICTLRCYLNMNKPSTRDTNYYKY